MDKTIMTSTRFESAGSGSSALGQGTLYFILIAYSLGKDLKPLIPWLLS